MLKLTITASLTHRESGHVSPFCKHLVENHKPRDTGGRVLFLL